MKIHTRYGKRSLKQVIKRKVQKTATCRTIEFFLSFSNHYQKQLNMKQVRIEVSSRQFLKQISFQWKTQNWLAFDQFPCNERSKEKAIAFGSWSGHVRFVFSHPLGENNDTGQFCSSNDRITARARNWTEDNSFERMEDCARHYCFRALQFPLFPF